MTPLHCATVVCRSLMDQDSASTWTKMPCGVARCHPERAAKDLRLRRCHRDADSSASPQNDMRLQNDTSAESGAPQNDTAEFRLTAWPDAFERYPASTIDTAARPSSPVTGGVRPSRSASMKSCVMSKKASRRTRSSG